jgi:hypothetical protein
MRQADVCNPHFKDEYPCLVAVSHRSRLLPRATNRVLHFTRLASPSVVPPHLALSAVVRRACRSRALSSSPTTVRRLGSGIPVAFRPRLLSSSRSCRRLRGGLGRVHRVSVKEPWLVRPEMPSILEKPFSGSASIPRLCRRGPLPGSHFALRGRPLRASRPSAHPAATGFAFGWQMPLADFCSCKEYGHTGERPIPASKRAREWLVSLRPASCPAEREQATRQTEPKPRRRRSAAASTESTSSQRPRCGG